MCFFLLFGCYKYSVDIYYNAKTFQVKCIFFTFFKTVTSVINASILSYREIDIIHKKKKKFKEYTLYECTFT